MIRPDPCPFDHGDPSLQSVTLPMQADCTDIVVVCTDCGAQGPSVLFDQAYHDADDIPELEEEAVRKWNDRG